MAHSKFHIGRVHYINRTFLHNYFSYHFDFTFVDFVILTLIFCVKCNTNVSYKKQRYVRCVKLL